MVKYFRIATFIFFAIALYGCVDCLRDSDRVLEHSGAWFGAFICVLACVFSTINPDNLL